MTKKWGGERGTRSNKGQSISKMKMKICRPKGKENIWKIKGPGPEHKRYGRGGASNQPNKKYG